MPRFAHISDCHLGAWRDKTLRQLNLNAFMKAMDTCAEKNVDFILICGDLFDKNIPDLDIVEQAARKMREIRSKGIEIYVIYGSHDYSPAATSIIDVLHSSGLFTKIMDADSDYAGDKISLNFIHDKKTGAKIAGISGRRASLERYYYEILDRERLEKEQGFKIFAFHIGVNELMGGSMQTDECIPMSFFPRGFNYYAGGHIHSRIEKNENGYGLFVYPGTTFGWNYNDLENTANGEQRGFLIVDFEDKIKNIEFVGTMSNDVKLFDINADGKTADHVKELLESVADGNNFQNSIALVKLKGAMSVGKQSEINTQPIREKMYSKGAVNVFINRNALSSKELDEIKLNADDRSVVEARVFKEQIGMCASYSTSALKGDEGVETAKDALNAMKEGKMENETKADYIDRIISKVSEILKVKI
ncbi:MAG: DNA repair exonuclease [Candidatus Aenigmarchaeota archaeon]|nr:DNA repair exonuclease [Candidatus Aenigmarchaeota archaeon]